MAVARRVPVQMWLGASQVSVQMWQAPPSPGADGVGGERSPGADVGALTAQLGHTRGTF